MTATSFAQAAYGSAAIPLRTNRGAELAAFETTTARLLGAVQPTSTMAMRATALHDNRRLWTALAVDVAAEGNDLPQPLRAQIFYLAEFSLITSQKALRDRSLIPSLVEINRSMMRGLDGSTVAA